MASGILIIDKPSDWTSMDVCAKLRGIFHEKRVGHAGTLDPMATGVLPVFLGRATRCVSFASESDKEYIAQLQLGVVTNTQDTTGQVLQTHPVNVSAEQLQAALIPFRGPIAQTPPMYSAIKIGGKRLYELARRGKEVERPARPITIHTLSVEGQTAPDQYTLRIRCSKGTYVRTLCHDIGQALGCGGCMGALRRSMAAGFTLDNALTLEQVQAAQDPCQLLLPVDSYFAGRPMVLLTAAQQEKQVRNGMAVAMPQLQAGEYRVYGTDGTFLALSRCNGQTLTTIKSFYEV